ncbi:hypothetical protein ABTD73_19055, partial [Acinetobacter baumannii]
MDDITIMARLISTAQEHYDGHLTILKFTTNWRVSFETPIDHDHIATMPSGKTFAEAGLRCLAANQRPSVAIPSQNHAT